MGCASSTPVDNPAQTSKLNIQNKQNGISFYGKNDDTPFQRIEPTKDVLERYLELERLIKEADRTSPEKNTQLKKMEIEEMKKREKELEEELDNLRTQTQKEKDDVSRLQKRRMTVVDIVKEQEDQFKTQLSKEQKEVIEAVNRQEVCERELEAIEKQIELLTKELETVSNGTKDIQKLYQEQEDLLNGIFDGDYGSEEENRLEGQLDLLVERKKRISVAKYKWTNAKILVQHACQQLGVACEKWQEIIDGSPDPQNIPIRYALATEVRNNLIAAIQNLQSAQRYLNTIKFPYCKPDEVETLSRAANNIYSDMQHPDGQKAALVLYQDLQKRAMALIRWIDHVIDQTIAKDLEEANKSTTDCHRALRKERIKLIVEKIKTELGQDVQIDESNFELDDNYDAQSVFMSTTFQADNSLLTQTGDPVSDARAAGVLIPAGSAINDVSNIASKVNDKDIAPPPSQEDLFGNIDELRKQHEREMQEFQRAQELNKARMDQGLQDKLAARRNRRKRMREQD